MRQETEETPENKGKIPENPESKQPDDSREEIVTANGLTEDQWLMINGC